MARRRLTIVATIVALGAFIVVAAKDIPPLLEIPSEVASVHPGLVSKRAALLQERNALRNRTVQHNAQCSAVTEGTAEEASCRSELAALTSDVNDHIQRSSDFNKAVSAIVAAAVTSGPIRTPDQLRLMIKADEEAIRRLGFENRAVAFKEWETLTWAVQDDLKAETRRILLSLLSDEVAALSKKAVSAVGAFDLRKAKTLIAKLEEVGVNDPYLADAIRLVASAVTKEEKLKAANALVDATRKQLKVETVMKSESKVKAVAEAGIAYIETTTSRSPPLRFMVAATELTAQLTFAIGQQHIIESRVSDMTRMTEQQLMELQRLSDRLRAHVLELNALK